MHIGEIETVPGGAQIALRFFAEVAAIAVASGALLPEAFVNRTKSLVTEHRSTRTSSMHRDLKQERPVEVEQILGNLLARARALAVDAPLLEAAVANLRIYERASSTALIGEVKALSG